MPDTPDSQAIYVRGDITVPDEAAQFKGPSAFAMMLAQEGNISEFLADAENPAHTKWVATADRVKRNWTYPAETLSQVRNAPVTLHKMLATGKERVDANALKDFFWIEDPDRAPEKDGGPPKKRKRSEPVPPLPPSKRKLILRRREGGFSLRPGPGFDAEPLPAVARITVRYDVETGQPTWDPLDFDLGGGDINIEAKGAEVDASENVITLTIEERDFELVVKGFDRRRDLVVDYNLLKTPETADA
jgi:hypothetical protein